MVMARPGWVRIGTPAATGAQAAAAGHGADVAVSKEGVVAGPWLLRGRAPAVPATAPVVEEGLPDRRPMGCPPSGRGGTPRAFQPG